MVEGWESLKQSDYSVGYLAGGKKVAEKLLQTLPSDQLIAVDTLDQGRKMLLFGRVDIFVTFELPMMEYLNSQALLDKSQNVGQGQEIHSVGLLESITSHAWLYQAHRELAPRLGTVLREMKAEGLFQVYCDQVGIGAGELSWYSVFFELYTLSYSARFNLITVFLNFGSITLLLNFHIPASISSPDSL